MDFDKEPRQEGPYKFSQDKIRDLFDESFRIDSIKETVYQGTLDRFLYTSKMAESLLFCCEMST
jgi:hypothetical protein